MENLVIKSEKGNPITTSLLVAQKFGKNHKDVLRAIDNVVSQTPESQSKRNFAPSEYRDATGKANRMYIMTKDGFSFLVMGFSGEDAMRFKWEFINAFNKMEEVIKSGGFQVPNSFKEALLLAAQQQEQIEEQQKQLEQQRPAVVFRDSVANADTHITVRELAKLICQNGVDVGEHRMYDWLVENKYLIRHERYSKSKQRYVTGYYEPYQCHVNTGLFFTKETVVGEGNSSFIRKTVYITGKGQVYFINKFIKEKAA